MDSKKGAEGKNVEAAGLNAQADTGGTIDLKQGFRLFVDIIDQKLRATRNVATETNSKAVSSHRQSTIMMSRFQFSCLVSTPSSRTVDKLGGAEPLPVWR